MRRHRNGSARPLLDDQAVTARMRAAMTSRAATRRCFVFVTMRREPAWARLRSMMMTEKGMSAAVAVAMTMRSANRNVRCLIARQVGRVDARHLACGPASAAELL